MPKSNRLRKAGASHRFRIGVRRRIGDEVDAFLLDHQWALEYLSVYRADVLPQNTDKQELNRAKKENPCNQRRHADGKPVPKQELVNEIDERKQNAQQRAGE